MNAAAEEVLAFWLDEVGPVGWYQGGEALDATCRERFLGVWERAWSGALDAWAGAPRPALALIILLDQLPRNMFRGDARAFATDAKARAVAKGAIGRGFDTRIEEPARQFFYLPLTHSENITDQERSVRLFVLRYETEDMLKHARAHRAVIRRFGRFPYRNAALGRSTTPAETAFLDAGGYAAALKEVGRDDRGLARGGSPAS